MGNGIVAWLDEGLVNNQELHVGQPYEVNDTVLESETWPWHVESGQPNDCDGPGTETCMFIGPHGRWFDFACAPKVANRETGVTAGPEVVWEDGVKREYNVNPLCGLWLPGEEARLAGLRIESNAA